MELERKAIYNLLRMNKPQGTLPWQIENYRLKSTEDLFCELGKLNVKIDSRHFLSHADHFDSPEELCDTVLPDDLNPKESDRIFLIFFELWRRLLPEKQSLSILCDELDDLIYSYDEERLESEEPLQDALTHLTTLLEENVDAGLKPEDLFHIVQINTANDIESFLFDYIAEKIDQEELNFALELLENFSPYVRDKSWFEFLQARVLSTKDPESANFLIQEIASEVHDPEFALELLQFLAHFGDHKLFLNLAKKTIGLITKEDEFQDLLLIAAKYFRCLDHDETEAKIITILEKRSKYPLERPVQKEDGDLKIFKAFLI